MTGDRYLTPTPTYMIQQFGKYVEYSVLRERQAFYSSVSSSSSSFITTHWLSDLAVFVVEKDVAGAVVFEVGDLQAVGVSDLLWLEGCVDGVHLDHSFGLLGLQGGGGGGAHRSITFGFNTRLLAVNLLFQVEGV